MMLFLAFALFFALVALWLVAPNGAPERASEGPIASPKLAAADATA